MGIGIGHQATLTWATIISVDPSLQGNVMSENTVVTQVEVAAPKANKVKKVGLFGTFSNLFTATVPKAGSVIERSLNIVDLGLSAAEKQVAVLDMESEIDLIDAAGDHAEALIARSVTMDQLNAIKLARGIK